MILTLASSLTSTSAWIERLRYKSSSLFLTAILWATRDTAYPYATRRITGVQQFDFTEASGLGSGDQSTGTVPGSGATPAPSTSSTQIQLEALETALQAGPDENGLYTVGNQKYTKERLDRAIDRIREQIGG